MKNEDEILKTVQTLISEREQARKERDEARAALFNMQALANSDCPKCRELDELIRMIPKKPNAITYEHGWTILDYLQDTLVPRIESLQKETPSHKS